MTRTRAPHRRRGGDDAGFSLIEVTVSVAIIAVVMLGLGAVFVATAAGTDVQGSRQAAARIATDGLDRVHALSGSGVVKGRDQVGVDTQWASRPTGVTTLLTGLTAVADPTAAAGSGGTAPLPTTPISSTVDGITYAQSFFVAACQLDAGSVCRATAGTGTVAMYDVVVSVAWRDKSCRGGTCTYELSALVGTDTTEPLFNSNVKAVGPTVSAIVGQVLDVTEAVTGPRVAFSGGNGAVSLTATGLPTGVTLDPNTGTFGGLVSAVTAPTTVTVTATDRFGLFGQTTFTWTVNALPTLTAAAVPLVTGLTTTIDLRTVLALTGGTPAHTWACAGLPASLTLDRTTGVLTGLVATLGLLTPSCTVTDARGRSSTAALSLTVLAPLAVTAPANGSTSLLTRTATVRTTATASGCSGVCTWSVDRLPAGLTLDPATGVVTGKPTTIGSTTVTFTVRDTATRTAKSTVTWRVL